METAIFVPQQEQTTEETAPALRPWTTPRLQRLNQAASETDKIQQYWEDTAFDYGPS